MAAPYDADWSNTNMSDAALNGTTHGSGTTTEREAVGAWPANRPFFDSDEDTWYYNGHASAPSSVTWKPMREGLGDTGYTDPFTSDIFVDQHAANIGVDAATNFRLDFDIKRDGTNDASTVDLEGASALNETLSSIAWIVRYKYVLSTLTQAASANFKQAYFGISDLPSSSDETASHDFVGLYIILNNSTNTFRLANWNSTSLAGAATTQTDLTNSPAAGTYYVEMKRLGATLEIRMYSDDAFTILTDFATIAIPSTITGLQYFGIWNDMDVSDDHTITGYIDDLQVWNAIEKP